MMNELNAGPDGKAARGRCSPYIIFSNSGNGGI
jgi:hypothetical protein